MDFKNKVLLRTKYHDVDLNLYLIGVDDVDLNLNSVLQKKKVKLQAPITPIKYLLPNQMAYNPMCGDCKK